METTVQNFVDNFCRELYLYEAVSSLDAGTADIIVTGYNGKERTTDLAGNDQKLSAQDYVYGMIEGVLLYGKHGYQEVGKDISETSYFAKLPEHHRQAALSRGRDLRVLETNEKVARVREAIERAKAKKDADTQKNTAEDGGNSMESNYNSNANSNVKENSAEAFRKRLDSWDGRTEGFSFVLGNTSSALQEAGIPKKQIRLDATKVVKTLNKHNGMSIDVLKQLPDLLENPVIIIDSKQNENARIIMGDLKDENGKTVTAVLLLTPTSKKGNVLDLLKISSAEGRGHIQSLFTKEDGSQVDIRYVDKKRIQEWLNVNRVQFPLRNRILDFGSSATTGIIPQKTENVKGKVFYDERINLDDLTEKQRDEIEFAGTVIAAIGNTVHFYNSQYAPKDSREARTNGWYDPKDGSIHLDIAKIERGEESVLFTLSHELVHFIEDWSPAKYQTFANFLLKEYAEHGVSTDKLVHQKMAELKTTDYDYTMSELVADACERMLLDSNAAQKLAELNKTDKKLGAKIKEFFSNVLKRIRNAYANYKGRTEAQYLQKMDDVLSEFHEMFAEALTDAARNYQDADGKLGVSEVREQAKYDSYNQPINMEDIQSLQMIGRKSVNQFSDADLQKTKKWAHKLYLELGVKSPFFRAWFGDWRAYDKTPIKAVEVDTVDIDVSQIRSERGVFSNTDTGWSVVSGAVGEGETKRYSRGNNDSVKMLVSMQRIMSAAILLDTEISERTSSKKHINTVFMHKMYAPVLYGGKEYIARINVEEYFEQGDSRRRVYHLEGIKIEPTAKRFADEISLSHRADVGSIDSIADLFAFVKRFDSNFEPKAVDKIFLNQNGTPKVFYHGSKNGGGFSEFKDWQYFTESKDYAMRYTQRENKESLYEVYVKMEKPFDTRRVECKKIFEKVRQEYGLSELQDTGLPDWTDGYDISNFIEENDLDYDGIILDEGGDLVDGEPISRGLSYVVRNSSQIKSTENIGTFSGEKNIRYQQKQTSNRAILADLLEASIDTSTPEGIRQADLLDGYRANIGEIEDLEDRIRDASAEIKSIAFSTGKRDMERYNRLIEDRNRDQIRLE